MARPKHRTKPGETYFVTTDTWERRKVFLKAAAAKLVETKLFEYRDKGRYYVHSYVVMPEHFHVLLTRGKTTTLERLFIWTSRFGTRDSWSMGFEMRPITKLTCAIFSQTP